MVVLLAVADIILSSEDIRSAKLRGLVPGALIMLGVTRMFFCAAAVTDKCAHVPSLINSLDFSCESPDHERQYVVDYILHSAAGFYVFEVRLNSELALKFLYMCGIVTFALATKVLS